MSLSMRLRRYHILGQVQSLTCHTDYRDINISNDCVPSKRTQFLHNVFCKEAVKEN